MKTITRILVTSVLVILLSYFMHNVHINNVFAAIKVAVVLALLNTFLKPILVFFTIPITILTLGLFLLVVNAMIIMLCDHFLDDFTVDNFWTAFFFSIILSISQSVVYKFTDEKTK
jgi:putative membrane protein